MSHLAQTEKKLSNSTEPESSRNGDLILYLNKIGINNRYHNAVIERIYVKDEIHSFTKNLDQNITKGRGLLISGPVGVGKTSIMSYIAQKVFQIRNEMTEEFNGTKRVISSRQKYVCLFISTSKLFDLFFKNDAKLIRPYENCNILLLDDFGRQHDHEFPITKFEDFVEERYSRMRSTIVTTNYTPDKLKELNLYDRVIDRWRDGMELITINKNSQRGRFNAN